MKVGYYPGCSLHGTSREFDESLRAVAEVLGVGQESVSRLEKRSDLLLSTLRGYVKAMGGELRLVAEFPNRPPVLLKGFAAMNSEILPAVAENGDPNDFGTHSN